MLPPLEGALLRSAMEKNFISSGQMMEIIKIKTRRVSQASVQELLVSHAQVHPDQVSALAREVGPAVEALTPPSGAVAAPFIPFGSPPELPDGQPGAFSPVDSKTAEGRPIDLILAPPDTRPSRGAEAALPDTEVSRPVVAVGPQRPAPEVDTDKAVGSGSDEAAPPGYRWPLKPGEKIGHYTIKEILGRGGMGQVFRVRHDQLERDYALKVLLPRGASSPRLLARFRHEARATARLRHPNIVAVHEVGDDHGIAFFTMDLIDGEPLSHLVGRKSLSLNQTLKIICKVATALHHAHREGVIHRDLKPSNIIVAKDGEPILMDFGLAKELHASTHLTRTGTAVGTLAYMPPEQAQGLREQIGPKSDLYSLGVTMYECLTGSLPYTADNAPALIARLITGEAEAPHKIMPEIPEPVSRICMQAMHKEPAKRYGTAMDLCRDIERFLDGEPISAQGMNSFERWVLKAKKNRPATLLSGILGLTLVILALGAAWNAYARGAQYRDTLRLAEETEKAGDFPRALELFSNLVGLEPEDARGHFGSTRVREKIARLAEEEAQRWVDQGFALIQEHKSLLGLIEADKRKIMDVGGRLRPSDPVESKEALFAARDTLKQRQKQAVETRARAIGALHRALGLRPEHVEARQALAEIYRAELAEAEAEGDADDLPALRGLVELYSGGKPLAEQPGTLQLKSKPEGAQVYLFRFEEERLRWIPKPYHPLAESSGVAGGSAAWAAPGEPPLWLSDENYLGTTPLLKVALRPGNYLLVLRLNGKRDTRVPVRIEPGQDWLNHVRLYSEAEIGDGFVYVPADNALLGGDRLAFQPLERHPDRPTTYVRGFFMAQHEITRIEYREFLATQSVGEEGQLRLVPRSGEKSGALWRLGPQGWEFAGHPQEPVTDISHEDALAYARWRGLRDGKSYELPSSQEWEKAARGVDGRRYVWGDEFEPSFSLTGYGRVTGAPLVPVGSFATDTSVYGIRDLSGSVREFCRNLFEQDTLPLYGREESGLVEVRGAAFTYMTDFSYLRVGTRLAYPRQRVRNFFGIRLVRPEEVF